MRNVIVKDHWFALRIENGNYWSRWLAQSYASKTMCVSPPTSGGCSCATDFVRVCEREMRLYNVVPNRGHQELVISLICMNEWMPGINGINNKDEPLCLTWFIRLEMAWAFTALRTFCLLTNAGRTSTGSSRNGAVNHLLMHPSRVSRSILFVGEKQVFGT